MSDCLYNGVKVIDGIWTDEEIEYINGLNLLTAKPTVYLLNVSKSDYIAGTNQFWDRVQDWINTHSRNDKLIMFSAEYEHALNNGEAQSKELIIPTAIREMRDSLHLISFYTCGDIESRQWTIRKGSLAPDAAGLIHTDLQKTFINSVVYKWDDLAPMEVFDENKLKLMGKQYRNGKSTKWKMVMSL